MHLTTLALEEAKTTPGEHSDTRMTPLPLTNGRVAQPLHPNEHLCPLRNGRHITHNRYKFVSPANWRNCHVFLTVLLKGKTCSARFLDKTIWNPRPLIDQLSRAVFESGNSLLLLLGPF
jgi:hypothetical protein